MGKGTLWLHLGVLKVEYCGWVLWCLKRNQCPEKKIACLTMVSTENTWSEHLYLYLFIFIFIYSQIYI